MTSPEPRFGDPDLRHRLRRMIELRSLARVADELGVGRQSLACYLARLTVQPGTLALIEQKLAAVDDAGGE